MDLLRLPDDETILDQLPDVLACRFRIKSFSDFCVLSDVRIQRITKTNK